MATGTINTCNKVNLGTNTAEPALPLGALALLSLAAPAPQWLAAFAVPEAAVLDVQLAS